jgi:hypothetical protein
MATLTVNTLVQAAGTSSITSLFAANNALMTASSSAGDKFTNTGKEFLAFQNSSSQGAGATITIGVTAQNADNFGGAASLHNLSLAIASSSFGLTIVGPFPPAVYNDATGFTSITYSAGGLAVGVFSVAPRS